MGQDFQQMSAAAVRSFEKSVQKYNDRRYRASKSNRAAFGCFLGVVLF